MRNRVIGHCRQPGGNRTAPLRLQSTHEPLRRHEPALSSGRWAVKAPGVLASPPVALLLAPLLLVQGMWVRRSIPRLPEAAGPRAGDTGAGPKLRLVVLGDSIVAGVGTESTDQALPAQFAAALARRLACRVHWSSHGANGARTVDLLEAETVERCHDADLLLISNGLNDVTGLARLAVFEAEKSLLFSRLRAAAPGALIAQLGIPPLAHFPALPQPLRAVLGQRARRFDTALEKLVNSQGNAMYLPFREVPDPSLFAGDGYHPGPDAVRIWAGHLAVEIAAAMGAGTGD
jgi:lysophospholipase L1-like esterase